MVGRVGKLVTPCSDGLCPPRQLGSLPLAYGGDGWGSFPVPSPHVLGPGHFAVDSTGVPGVSRRVQVLCFGVH